MRQIGFDSLSPFAVRSRRSLVVAPNLRIRRQLFDDVDVQNDRNFYYRIGILDRGVAWEPVYIAGDETAVKDILGADIVVTNIQQLARDDNRWLDALPADCFDLILFDEAHHNTARSWQRLREKFPEARIVSLTATPLRADGQRMVGDLVYMYPVVDAMQAGYVKHLRALMLNPSTLRYLEVQGGVEVEVSLDEVRELARTDAVFRRAIVMSPESLGSIVDASIVKLREIRERNADNRHKIIASALNMTHCHQVVRAFQERGLRVDYVHAERGEEENDRVVNLLERHEIDAIVQIRMLGEGFDHPYLSVAAVCGIFGNLGPFIQFIGRIMRIVPGSASNEGVVVFHAGSNIAPRWDDFREYSQVDQQFFAQLLPIEEFGFDPQVPGVEIDPLGGIGRPVGLVQAQDHVLLEEMPLVDDEVARALDLLVERGIEPTAVSAEMELRKIHVPAQRRRQAKRDELHAQIRTRAAQELHARGLRPYNVGPRPPDTNLVTAVRAINTAAAAHVERARGTRGEWDLDDFTSVEAAFDEIVEAAMNEVFGAR